MKSRFIFLGIISLLSWGCSKNTTAVLDFEGGKLDINEVDFEYFEGKTKITFKDADTDVRAKASIRIRRDSVIWMSFSSAGITGGKCLIDKDSITVLNQLSNEYSVYKYDELSQKFNFNINYETIQAAAIGNLIIQRDESDRASQQNEFMVLRQKSGGISVENFINKDTHKITMVGMKEMPSENEAIINYTNFQYINDQYFPFSGLISLFYKTEDIIFNTSIEFEYSKAEISDKPLRFPFRIPKKYVER
ncbi:MAG: DUF4292 domain-containing protein [Cyclobacteriaceae bacterium]|nr:DUF4292 domain-containing protein [Cyclobacteriaceae bacterium]